MGVIKTIWKRKFFCNLAAVCFAAMGATSGHAEFTPEDLNTRPMSLEWRPSDTVDSVDPRNGNLLVQHRDLVLPGNGGQDIVVWRTYSLNEASAGLGLTHSQSYRWTALGPGWTLGVAPILRQDNLYKYGPLYEESPMLRLCEGNFSKNFGQYLIRLELPNGERQELYPLGNHRSVTKGNWKVECISNNVTATSPDGTVFDFGNIAERRIGIFAHVNVHPPELFLPARSETYMVAKKATDRNGNTLTYEYKDFGTPIPIFPMPSPNTDYGHSPPPLKRAGVASFYESRSTLLSRVTSSDGRIVNFTYDSTTGRLLTMSDGAGRSWIYSHSEPNTKQSRTLSRVTLPTGRLWNYDYAPGDFLESGNVIQPLNVETATSRKLARITYPTGGYVTFQYGYFDLVGRGSFTNRFSRGEQVVRRSLSTGESWSYTYTRGGPGEYDTTKVVGPEGTTTYRHMGTEYLVRTLDVYPAPGEFQNNAWRVGRLMQKIDPTGGLETYTWYPREVSSASTHIFDLGKVHDDRVWSAELQSRTITRDGAAYSTVLSNYDAYGNAGTSTQTGPNGGSRTTTYTYLNDTSKWIIGKLRDEIFPGGETMRKFDANGNLVSLRQDGVVTASYSYTPAGDLASKTLIGGRITTYSNYKRGIAQTEVQPEGVTITRVVDDAGNITSETDGNGLATTYTYDGLNRVTSIRRPGGNPETITYGVSSKTSTRGGLVVKTQYDSFGRLAEVTRGGIMTTYKHDGLGRMTFESNPGAVIGKTYQYDALNRIVKVTNADGTFLAHSYGAGNRSITDERGKTTKYSFRSYGDPAYQKIISIDAPEVSANVVIERNARDLITKVTQGGFSRIYGYDSRYHLVSVTDPETGVTAYERDLAGNMISKSVGASAKTLYAYDGRDRLKSVTYPSGTPSVTYSYTKTDQVKSIVSSVASRNYQYDANGNMTVDSTTIDGYALNVGYTYNLNDQLASIIYPRSGRVVAYSPDVLGRPTQVSGYITAVSYWPSGQLKQINYANGTVSNYGQNNRLWPTTFSTQKDSTAYLNTSYAYDGVGNLTTIDDTVDNSFDRTLSYDGIDRMTGVRGPWGAGTINYNGVGNITSQALGPTWTLNYSYDAKNRLTGISGSRVTNYTYDVYGNIASAAGNTYAYDNAPRLRCVNCANTANKIEYAYDGGGRRVWTLKGSVKAYEVHDNKEQQLVEFVPSQSNKLTEFIYLDGKRIAQRVTP